MSRRFLAMISVAMVLAAYLAAATPAHAAAPDWLLALQRTPVLEYPPEIGAVVLLNEVRTVVDDKGQVKTFRHVAYKILSPEGEHLARVSASYDPDTQVTAMRGWNLKDGGIVHETTDQDIVITQASDYALFEDTKTAVVFIPQVETGSIIGYEYEQRQRPSILQDSWYFGEIYPVLKSRVILELPDGWEYRHRLRNHGDITPRQAGKNNWVWEMENLDAIPDEEGMPPLAMVSPELMVAYFSRDGGGSAKSFDSWDEVAGWFNEFITPRAAPTASIQEQARQLATPQAAAEYAQKQIRYVAVEIGVGGYQPHFADEIFRNKYGDCKDKVTLMMSLLQTLGSKAYPVLINLGGRNLLPEFPSPLYFNHVIAALPLSDDLPAASAVLEDPQLGRLLLFDPTDTKTPFGQLPTSLQGIKALVVKDGRGIVIDTPVAQPSQNRSLRDGKFQLLPEGGIRGEFTELYWGAAAAQERQLLLDMGHDEWLKSGEQFLSGWLPGVALDKFAVGNLDQAGFVTETYQFQAPSFAQHVGDLLIIHPCVLGSKALLLPPQEDRKFPFRYSYLRSVSDHFVITLPPGYEVEALPERSSRESAFATYQSVIVQNGNTLEYTRRLELKLLLVPAESVAELRAFYQLIDEDERSVVLLRRVTAPLSP